MSWPAIIFFTIVAVTIGIIVAIWKYRYVRALFVLYLMIALQFAVFASLVISHLNVLLAAAAAAALSVPLYRLCFSALRWRAKEGPRINAWIASGVMAALTFAANGAIGISRPEIFTRHAPEGGTTAAPPSIAYPDNVGSPEPRATVGQSLDSARTQTNPQEADEHFNRGLAYSGQDDYAHAIAEYDEAIRLNPKYAEAYSNRGNAYRSQHNYANALSDYNEAIKIYPKLSILYNNRGLLYVDRADYTLAVADFREAIRLDSRYAEAYANRGMAYRNLGDDARAVADSSEAIRLDPQSNRAYYNRGLVRLKQSRFQDAWNDYDAAIRINAGSALYFYGRGVAALNLGRSSEGRSDIARATELDPNIAEIYASVGITPPSDF